MCPTKVIVVADRQDYVIDGAHGVAVGGRKPRQADRKVRLALSVTAVLSDSKASAKNPVGGEGIGVAVGIAVREERQGNHVGIVGGVGLGEQAFGGRIASSLAPAKINARTRRARAYV